MVTMVQRVTKRHVQLPPHGPEASVFVPGDTEALVDSLVSFCSELPWEHMVSFGSGAAGAAVATRRAPPAKRQTPAPTTRAPALALAPISKPASAISRPGCTAADSALLNLGYLEGLSRGLGGYGVLRVGRERLEEGVRAAQQLGHPDLAREMQAIAQELPQVKDATAAGTLADKLRPVADRAWSLGAACKGSLSPEQMTKARELARQVKEGKLSMSQAVKQVTEGE